MLTSKISSIRFYNVERSLYSGALLTSAAGQDVASLPAGRAGLPHAVMLPRGLPRVQVCTAHLPRLEAVAAAGGGAWRPRANTPVEGAGLRGAVLQGGGPADQRRWASEVGGHKYKYGVTVLESISKASELSQAFVSPTTS